MLVYHRVNLSAGLLEWVKRYLQHSGWIIFSRPPTGSSIPQRSLQIIHRIDENETQSPETEILL